jgi:hypothetical protein
MRPGEIVFVVYRRGSTRWQEEAKVLASGEAETHRGHRVPLAKTLADSRRGWEPAAPAVEEPKRMP